MAKRAAVKPTLHDKIVQYLKKHHRSISQVDRVEWIYGQRKNEPPPKLTERKEKRVKGERNHSPSREDLLHFYANELDDFIEAVRGTESRQSVIERLAGKFHRTPKALEAHLMRWRTRHF